VSIPLSILLGVTMWTRWTGWTWCTAARATRERWLYVRLGGSTPTSRIGKSSRLSVRTTAPWTHAIPAMSASGDGVFVPGAVEERLTEPCVGHRGTLERPCGVPVPADNEPARRLELVLQDPEGYVAVPEPTSTVEHVPAQPLVTLERRIDCVVVRMERGDQEPDPFDNDLRRGDPQPRAQLVGHLELGRLSRSR
jgi:hypothetical protein